MSVENKGVRVQCSVGFSPRTPAVGCHCWLVQQCWLRSFALVGKPPVPPGNGSLGLEST
jgi:hypothetical protein